MYWNAFVVAFWTINCVKFALTVAILPFMDISGLFVVLEKELRDMGLNPKRITETGIIADIKGKGKKTVAIRADIDANHHGKLL